VLAEWQVGVRVLKFLKRNFTGIYIPLIRNTGLIFCAFTSVVNADGLIFADLIALDRDGLDADSSLQTSDVLPRLTLFYTQDFANTKILAEFVANDKKSHFGRVKFGWQANQSNLFWIGRTHNPAGYWREQFHHGGWLQPTITRPAIAEFEVPGGVLPAHTTGLMYEGGSSVNNNEGLAYVASWGYTSAIDESGMDVPDLFVSDRGRHNTSVAFRVSYRFEGISGGDEVGFFSAYNHIPITTGLNDEAEQLHGGLFANWHFSDLKLISEFNFIRNDLINSSSVAIITEDFSNMYIMADYSLNNKWNVYSRLEDTYDEENNEYLSYFTKFVTKRNLMGVRYSINRNQIIKFEINKSKLFSGEDYRQLAVQWSFVYP